jgi:hypothetical protein
VVRFFVRVRVIRHQAEVIQVGCDSFQHADHPRPIESDKLRLDIFIGPKIHDHVFATLQRQSISPAHDTLTYSVRIRNKTRTIQKFQLCLLGPCDRAHIGHEWREHSRAL